MPGQAQECGQQSDGHHHHDRHDECDGDPAASHERHSRHGKTENGDHDDATGEDHRLTGGGNCMCDGVFDRGSPLEIVAMTGYDEQCVVDADAETDHSAEYGGPVGDVDQVRKQ